MYPEITAEKRYRKQVINLITVNEFLSGNHGYANTAIDILKQHQIEVSQPVVWQTVNNISNGHRSADFPSVFNGKVSPRTEKDNMYAAFWRTVEMFITDELSYIGLPARQIELVASEKVKDPRKVIACESCEDTARWIDNFYDKTNRRAPILIKKDIFDVLLNLANSSKHKFNVFDFDLCNGITSNPPFYVWANLIYWNSADQSAINITSTIGRRTLSKEKYESIMPRMMIEALREVGFKEVKNYGGAYKDRVPMRFEHILVRK